MVMETFYETLVKALDTAGEYNAADQVAPAGILWTDKDRQWEKLILKSIRTMHRQAVYRIKDEVATLQVLFNMDELQMEELKSATEDLRKRATQLLV